MNNEPIISKEFYKRIDNALREESDRASIILITSWADHFLERKLRKEFSQGNTKSREALFSSNGAFATFSAKINAAFCAGWIDQDVYHDLNILRTIRNKFAHLIESSSLDAEPYCLDIAKLRVPKRAISDWGTLQAADTENSEVIIFSGERPPEARDNLKLRTLPLRLAASVLMVELLKDLGIRIDDLGDYHFSS